MAGGAASVSFENSVEIGNGGKTDRLGNLENTFICVGKKLFRAAYSYKVKILGKGCAGCRLEYSAKIAWSKAEHTAAFKEGDFFTIMLVYVVEHGQNFLCLSCTVYKL